MVKTKWNYLGLSTDDKADLPFFEQHNVDGSTFLAVDTGAVFIYYNNEWYELGATEPDADNGGDGGEA